MLIEKNNTEYAVCRIPGLVRTESGTLLCYYECRSDLSDWARIDIKIRRSTDGGATWQTVEIIPGGGNTLNNPVMIADGRTVHMLFCRNYRQLYHRISTDDGLSFSEPVELDALQRAGHPFTCLAVGPGHGIVHQGTLLIPMWFAYDPQDPKKHWPSRLTVLYSRDHGSSWHCGDILAEGLRDPNESCLAVTSDGEVLISIRNRQAEHLRALAVSPTGYAQWSDALLWESLPAPHCMGRMDTFGSEIFHINCADPEKRENLTIKVSENGFHTYRAISVDDVGGYSDLAVTQDRIFVLYERDIQNDGLYFKVIPRT